MRERIVAGCTAAEGSPAAPHSPWMLGVVRSGLVQEAGRVWDVFYRLLAVSLSRLRLRRCRPEVWSREFRFRDRRERTVSSRWQADRDEVENQRRRSSKDAVL